MVMTPKPRRVEEAVPLIAQNVRAKLGISTEGEPEPAGPPDDKNYQSPKGPEE